VEEKNQLKTMYSLHILL